MEAKDGSMGFDFEGEYTEIIDHEKIEYKLADERRVLIEFRYDATANTTTITETFDTEDENSAEQQRAGWQAILDNFKTHTEAL